MIELKSTDRTVRETTANFEYQNAAGEIVEEKIRVRYFSPRTWQQRQLYAELEETLEKKSQYWQSSQLAVLLAGLPDIKIDGQMFEPVPVTPAQREGEEWEAYQAARNKAEAFLDQIDVKNLAAIRTAMEDDIDPKSQGGK